LEGFANMESRAGRVGLSTTSQGSAPFEICTTIMYFLYMSQLYIMRKPVFPPRVNRRQHSIIAYPAAFGCTGLTGGGSYRFIPAS
jgi:hypothetical protein